MPPRKIDTQVSAVEKICERKSVLDVALRSIDLTTYDAAHPFCVRLVFCGKKENEPFNKKWEELITEVKQHCDKLNPFCTSTHEAGLGCFVIDYGEYFVQVLEGPESYAFHLAEKMRSFSSLDKSSVRVLFIDDDLPNKICNGVTLVDKVPPSVLAVSSTEKNGDEVADSVAHDLSSVLDLVSHGTDHVGRAKNVFVDNAKVNFPKLFPKVESLQAYITSNNFFTLDEFVTNFCLPASLVRDTEIDHPAADPLKY